MSEQAQSLSRDKNRMDELICIKDTEIAQTKKDNKDKTERIKVLEAQLENAKEEYQKMFEDKHRQQIIRLQDEISQLKSSAYHTS